MNKILNYEEFELALIEALEKRYPDVKVIKKSQYKINGVKHGIVLVGVGDIQPIIYPDSLYESYKKLEDVELVIDRLNFKITNDNVSKCKNIVMDWQQVKEHIYPYIVSNEKNKEYMDMCNYIYKEKLDFVYGMYVELPSYEESEIACVNITKELLNLWGVPEEEVFEMAEQNAKYFVRPMKQVIYEHIGEIFAEEDIIKGEMMYVLTNATGNRGAAGMFDIELLKATAEKLQSDFFILPSSIHEVILVREDMSSSKEMLREMVVEVNRTQLEDDEYLSDNVYYFNRKRESLEIAV